MGIKDKLENVTNMISDHLIITFIIAGVLTYCTYLKRYEIGNVFLYPDRPAIQIERLGRSSLESGPTEYHNVLVTAQTRSEAELSDFQIYRDNKLIDSAALNKDKEFVEFWAGSFGKPPKLKSKYRVRIVDSLGNFGEKSFSGFSGIRYLSRAKNRENFESEKRAIVEVREWHHDHWYMEPEKLRKKYPRGPLF